MSTVFALKPVDAALAPMAAESIARSQQTPAGSASLEAPVATALPPVESRTRQGRDRLGDFCRAVIPPLLGLVLMIGVWALVAVGSGNIPGPARTWDAAVLLFADPFYRNGPNDQGIGWNVLASLQRVGIGFGFAALIGIPIGFLLGRVTFLRRMFDPIISLLRPVSPLGLAADRPAGLQARRPGSDLDHLHLLDLADDPQHRARRAARAAGLPQRRPRARSARDQGDHPHPFPAVLPYMLTGIRLSIGTAWLVIVAAEMLTGGVGIGFWVWDEWNNLKVEHILIAIFVIGIVGFALEQALLLLARRFTYESR
jgi:nitrate/nitrite transport system permease protein